MPGRYPGQRPAAWIHLLENQNALIRRIRYPNGAVHATYSPRHFAEKGAAHDLRYLDSVDHAIQGWCARPQELSAADRPLCRLRHIRPVSARYHWRGADAR